MRQHQRRVHGPIQTGVLSGVGGHEPSRIHHEEHVLAPFHLIDPRDRAMAAGSGLPVDAAVLVVGGVLAQSLELGALAREAGPMHPVLAQMRAARHQLIAGDIPPVRIDPMLFG